MESHHVFSQLVLFALIWLFIMLHLTRPKRPVTALAATVLPEPLKPKRPRPSAPTPFEGLTHKPHCALCERDTAYPQAPPPVSPDLLSPTNRRPRAGDVSMHFCPHGDCDYRGWLGLGNLRANGHPSGGPWRQFHCTSCQSYFLETHGTIFHGKQAAVELIVRVLACLAEGLGIRATARVFEVDANTVLHWLVEAAEQLRAFSSYFLCSNSRCSPKNRIRPDQQLMPTAHRPSITGFRDVFFIMSSSDLLLMAGIRRDPDAISPSRHDVVSHNR
jgi:hypothetical protein